MIHNFALTGGGSLENETSQMIIRIGCGTKPGQGWEMDV